MSIQDIMDRLRPLFAAKWQDRLSALIKKKSSVSPEDAYKAGYWDGVVDGVDVGTDGGIIHQAPGQDSGFH